MNLDDESEKTLLQRPRGESAATGAEAPLSTEIAGRYVVPRGTDDPELGRGGMGRVLCLNDTHLGREVALKEFRLKSEVGVDTAAMEALFVREARVLARLEHPGVVPVYELGRRADGVPYYAMRRVRGKSLDQVSSRCASLEQRLALMPHVVDVVQTVGYAHSRGVVHGDLKPSNVMLSEFGGTQLIDWGLAVVDGQPTEGFTGGTAAYMSPEQAAGSIADPRSDVWALGVLLFEVLTGRTPFVGKSATEVLAAVQSQPLPRIDDLEPLVPAPLREIVVRALERDTAKRFQSAGEMAEALEVAQRAQLPKPVAARVAIALLALLAGGLTGWVVALRMNLTALREASLAYVAKARTERGSALAEAALLAWRAHDPAAADTFAQRALVEGEHPLARGLSWLVDERGAAFRRWSAKLAAPCASLAIVDGVAACGSLNVVALVATEDGRSLGDLSAGPRGWHRALAALGGGRLASGGDDRILRIWDVAARREQSALSALTSHVESLAASDGILYAGLGNGEVRRFEADAGSLVVHRHNGPVRVLAASSGSIASASRNRTLLDVQSETSEVDRAAGALAFGSGSAVFAGFERSIVRVDDSSVFATTNHHGDISELVASTNEQGELQRIVSAGSDGTIQTWLPDGALEGTISGIEGGVRALAVTPDGDLLVATGDRRLESWRLPSKRVARLARGNPSVFSVVQDGEVLAGFADGRIRRVDLDTGDVEELETRHTAAVRALASPKAAPRADGVRLLSGGDDGLVHVQRWNGDVDVLDSVAGGKVASISVSADGEHAAWSWDDGTRVLFSVARAKDVVRTRESTTSALAFSPNGRVLVSGGEDRRITAVDADSGNTKWMAEGFDGSATSISFEASGRHLVVGLESGAVEVLDAETGRRQRSLLGPRDRVAVVDVSSDGHYVAAGADDGSVWVWRLADGTLVGRAVADAGAMLGMGFLSERRLFAAGGDRLLHRLTLTP
jgi:WD40 repeat protein